jgi:hypothetical protein
MNPRRRIIATSEDSLPFTRTGRSWNGERAIEIELLPARLPVVS